MLDNLKMTSWDRDVILITLIVDTDRAQGILIPRTRRPHRWDSLFSANVPIYAGPFGACLDPWEKKSTASSYANLYEINQNTELNLKNLKQPFLPYDSLDSRNLGIVIHTFKERLSVPETSMDFTLVGEPVSTHGVLLGKKATWFKPDSTNAEIPTFTNFWKSGWPTIMKIIEGIQAHHFALLASNIFPSPTSCWGRC